MKVIDILKNRFRPGACLAVAIVAIAATGCGGDGSEEASDATDMPPGARPMSAEVQGLVDQGNAAQREGRYSEALDLYQQAIEDDPEHPVPQFGALMAAMAVGDTVLAASLAERLETTAPELLGMLNADGSMGGMPADPHAGMGGEMPPMPPAMGELPAGHPTLEEMVPDTLQPDTTGIR